MRRRDPETPDQWRDAVAMAEACLRLESARQYGLVKGGHIVDVDRCIDLRERGKALGYDPTEADIDVAVHAMIRGAR